MTFFKSKFKIGSRGVEIEDSLLTVTQQEAAKIEFPLDKKWLDMIWYAILLIILVLGGRVFFLTVMKGEYYKQIARGNKVRSVVIRAPRGKIFDRYGIQLVNNVPSLDAVFIPADLPKDEESKKRVIEKTAEILSLDAQEIREQVNGADNKSYNPFLIKQNISQDESLRIAEGQLQLPGIRIDKTATREYVDSTIFSHVVGYEGKIEKTEAQKNPDYLLTDYIGKYGIEKYYEQYLRGVNGGRQVEVDSMGNVKRELGMVDPIPGSDLILNIDAELQKKLYDSLVTALEATETKTAAAIAINPRNGAVMALISLPSFDNNLFSGGIGSRDYAAFMGDPNKPLFNRAISGEYPPGSTLKPVVAAAALAEKVITPSTIIDGLGGVLSIGSFHYRDWKVHGPSDVRKALAESNDIFFYTVGGGYGNIRGLGMDKMKKYENMFGFGKITGIDLGGEADGFIPDEQWKMDKYQEKWYTGNSYHASIGQGYILSTPIQVLNSVAAIANGGTLYQPRVVHQIKKNGGESLNNPAKIISDNFISRDLLQVVKEGMRLTITEGTAQSLKDLPIQVAGKTGTAQYGNENKTHGWFVSYAPYENPEIALIVLAEGGGEGHSSAVPVSKEIYEWYFSRGN